MAQAQQTAAVYSSPRDGLLREVVRTGLMKLGYEVRLMVGHVFDPLNADTAKHDLAIVSNLDGTYVDIISRYRSQGTPVLFIGPPLVSKPDLVRVSNADPEWLPELEGSATSRRELLGDLKVAEKKRVKAQPVAVVGQHPEGGIGHEDLRQWAVDAVSTLRKLTTNDIVWRPDPRNRYPVPGAELSKDSEESLAVLLEKAWVMVTHSAPCALQAILAGLPLVTDERSMFAPVARRLNDFGNVSKGATQDEVEPIFQAMSHIHWTRDEIQSGDALAAVLGYVNGGTVAAGPAPKKVAAPPEPEPEPEVKSEPKAEASETEPAEPPGAENKPAKSKTARKSKKG